MKTLLLILLIPVISFADSLNISNQGITYHSALAGDLSAAKYMKNKLTNDGAFVRHNELNITYINNSNRFVNATVLSDCFNNIAYHFAAGKQYSLSDDNTFLFMASAGVYIRPTIDQIRMEIGSRQNGMDVIPIFWLGLKKNIKLDENVYFSIQSNTNAVLTHTTFGLEIKF
jgi:hypothetical protein